ncbi:MAG TPA: hypothetical protein VM683_06285 [Anaeromyxobacteraceae bacterium]|jgi:hypothetical protein|nr:hypothetical protein [Anaeromyxobacteraceae bacterium]
MSFVAQLWLPILLSAVLVFFLSAASHMVLPWRRNEWGRITESDALQAALRGLKPGLYAFPSSPDPKQQMTKEWMERWAKGPSGWLTLAAPGPIQMGRNMGLSFLVFVLVAFFDAYVASHALGPAPHYRAVFRIVGTIGFLSFGVGSIFNSIWYSRPWRAYAADVIDALLFGLVMAGVFGWLWPR